MIFWHSDMTSQSNREIGTYLGDSGGNNGFTAILYEINLEPLLLNYILA